MPDPRHLPLQLAPAPEQLSLLHRSPTSAYAHAIPASEEWAKAR